MSMHLEPCCSRPKRHTQVANWNVPAPFQRLRKSNGTARRFTAYPGFQSWRRLSSLPKPSDESIANESVPLIQAKTVRGSLVSSRTPQHYPLDNIHWAGLVTYIISRNRLIRILFGWLAEFSNLSTRFSLVFAIPNLILAVASQC